MNNELERIKKNFKSLKIFMIIIDIFSSVILVIQFKMHDIAYYYYVLLVLCNLMVFLIKPEMCLKKDK